MDRPLATAGERTVAYLVDFLVLGPPLTAAASAFETRRSRLLGGGVLALLVANVYHVAFEGTTGRTPGKRALGVRVVAADGGPCGYRAATVRTLARFVDFLPAAYLVAFVSMARSGRRQRVGDRLGGTVVVREEG